MATALGPPCGEDRVEPPGRTGIGGGVDAVSASLAQTDARLLAGAPAGGVLGSARRSRASGSSALALGAAGRSPAAPEPFPSRDAAALAAVFELLRPDSLDDDGWTRADESAARAHGAAVAANAARGRHVVAAVR
jgi:hypothetical protein